MPPMNHDLKAWVKIGLLQESTETICWPMVAVKKLFYSLYTCSSYICTHVKISQLVASLQTGRQQVVFARLVPSCQQVWN